MSGPCPNCKSGPTEIYERLREGDGWICRACNHTWFSAISATSLQEVKPHPEQEPSSPQGWELLWHGGQWWLLLPVTVLVSVFAGLGANVGSALFGAVALTMGVWGLLNSKTANTAKLKRFIGTENRDVVVFVCVLGVLVGVGFLWLSLLNRNP